MIRLKIILTTGTLILALSTFAKQGFKASISMGPVYPLHQFASMNNENLNAGFAESGFSLNFDGDYYFHNRFAVSGRFHFGMSPINKTETYDWLKQNVGDYFDEDSLKTTIDYWQWSTPLVGIKLNYPIIMNKFYLEGAIFSGLNISSIPAQSMIISDSEKKQSIRSENIGKVNYSLPLMADAGFRLIFNENIQLKLTASYFQTKHKHRHVTYIMNNETYQVEEELKMQNIEVPIKTLNFSLGLIYTL